MKRINKIALTLGPLQTNCYIIYGEDKKAVIIDPAFYPDKIIEVLESYGLKADKILLTHAHFDHIMAVEQLRELGAELYVHHSDEEMLYNPKLNYMQEFMGKSIEFEKAEHILSDGDTIDFCGGQIEVVHTPGHTKGSVCYIVGDLMFTGDTLFCGSIGRTDLYGGSMDTLNESLKKLISLDKDYTVLAGHGSQSTLEKEKNDNIYMKTLR